MIGVILVAIIKLLTSPLGWTMFLVGLILPFAVLVVSNATGWSKPRDIMLGLAQGALHRSALLVTEQGELIHKSVELNEDGTAEITLDGAVKTMSDPDGAMAWLKGVPFALADETSGLFFDARHAWIGEQKEQARLDRELEAPATAEEGKAYGVRHWYLGVTKLPETLTTVDPTAVRNILTGGESADDGRHARQFYKNSRQPKSKNASFMRLLVPVIAGLAPPVVLFLLRNYLGSSSGGSVVSFSTLLPIGLQSLRDANWRRIAGWIAALCAVGLGAFTLGVGLLVDPFTTILLVGPVVSAVGLIVALPIVASLSNITGPPVGSLYWRLALLGVNTLNFVWSDGSWRVDVGPIDNATAIGRVYGTEVNIAFEPDDAFEESISAEAVGRSTEGLDQTGKIPSRIPVGYHRSKRFRREQHDQIGAYVPADLDIGAEYLRIGPALNRLAGGTDGEATAKKWQQAKEDLGMQAWMADDITLLKYSMLSMFAGSIMGSVLFYGDVLVGFIKVFI